MDYSEFIIRILMAFLLSFIVGLERQWRRRAIGLRTNVLVCIGSFLFVSTSVILSTEIDLKVAAQVVTGIGFLGAGVILKDGTNIRGLNTAATLWCNAAIGVLCAFGLIIEAIIGTFFILTANIVLRKITKEMLARRPRRNETKYNLKLVVLKEKELSIRTIIIQNIKDSDMTIDKMDATLIEEGKKTEIIAEVIADKGDTEDIENLVSRFSIEPGVTYVSYSMIKDEDYDLDDENILS